jgi:hypothetical protein
MIVRGLPLARSRNYSVNEVGGQIQEIVNSP